MRFICLNSNIILRVAKTCIHNTLAIKENIIKTKAKGYVTVNENALPEQEGCQKCGGREGGRTGISGPPFACQHGGQSMMQAMSNIRILCSFSAFSICFVIY